MTSQTFAWITVTDRPLPAPRYPLSRQFRSRCLRRSHPRHQPYLKSLRLERPTRLVLRTRRYCLPRIPLPWVMEAPKLSDSRTSFTLTVALVIAPKQPRRIRPYRRLTARQRPSTRRMTRTRLSPTHSFRLCHQLPLPNQQRRLHRMLPRAYPSRSRAVPPALNQNLSLGRLYLCPRLLYSQSRASLILRRGHLRPAMSPSRRHRPSPRVAATPQRLTRLLPVDANPGLLACTRRRQETRQPGLAREARYDQAGHLDSPGPTLTPVSSAHRRESSCTRAGMGLFILK